MSEPNDPKDTTTETSPKVNLNKPKDESSASAEPETTRTDSSGEEPRETETASKPEETTKPAETEDAAETGAEAQKQPAPETAKEKEIALGKASAWNRTFAALAKGGPIFLLLALCAAVIPNYFSDKLFCPAEIKNVTAFLQCVADKSWMMPEGFNPPGLFMPTFIADQTPPTDVVAQWPLFYWLIAALAFVPGLIGGNLLSVAAACSAAFALCAVWYLAIGARFGYRAAFAAGLILLCAPLFNPLPHFIGNAGLAVGFTVFAVAFFSRALIARRAWFSMPLAFVCSALAGLSGGPLLLLLPLAVAVCFLIWKGDFKRAKALDALFGFVLLLAIIGVWLAWISTRPGGDPYLRDLFAQSWSIRWPLPPYWWLALLIAVVAALPWTLMIFGVSWFRVLKTSPATLGASRRDNGSALVWTALVLACCLPFFSGHFHLVATLILCFEAALLGKSFVNLPPAGNRFFFGVSSILLIILGLLVLIVSFDITQQLLFKFSPVKPPEAVASAMLNLDSLPIVGGLLLLGGVFAFYFARSYKRDGGLVYAILLTLILCQVMLFGVAPEIGKLPDTPLYTLPQLEAQTLSRQKTAAAPAALPDSLPVPADSSAAPVQETAPASPTTPDSPEPVSPENSLRTTPEIILTPETSPAPVAPAPTTPENSGSATPEVIVVPGEIVPVPAPTANSPTPPTSEAPVQEKIEEVIIAPNVEEAIKDIEKNAAPLPPAQEQN